MCRIAAIISKNTYTLHSNISAMTNAMSRGGPDDSGNIINENFGYALGHRRLSIIDLSLTGHQPMIDDNNETEIVFNGEIYNYKELKEELKVKGYTFQSESDTEVLIKGYQEWGAAMLSKLKGMFAFVLVDKKNKVLFAARDHAGIKPLYIAHKQDEIYFSSEIRALKAIDENWEENPNWKIWFLTFGFLPEPITTLKGVKPLPRGHYITINLETKEEKTSAYCKYEYDNNVVSYKQAVEKTRTLVDAAVKRHLIADVPVGVFLSGGIDSSILAIVAQQQQTSPIETISIYFDNEKFSEKKYQDIIIKKTGVKHHLYKITKDEFVTSWNEIYESLDQPSTDAINTHFICKYAKQNGLKVVLSGLGADEIFGGYPSIKRANKFSTYSRMAVLTTWLPSVVLGTYPRKKLGYLHKKINASEYLLYRGLFTPKDVAKVLDLKEEDVWKELSIFSFQEDISQLSAQNRAAYYETAVYMQSQLLKDSDIQSMWHGLELRVPFLDKDLMEYVNNLDVSVKFNLNNSKPKPLLVDAYINELPEKIWNRPKQGFTFPFENWFKTMNMFKNQYFLSKEFYKKFYKNHISHSRVWAIFLTKIDRTNFSITDLNNLKYNPKTLFTYLTTFKESGGIQKVNKTILKALPIKDDNAIEAWGIYDNAVGTKYFPAYAYRAFNGNRICYFLQLITNSFKWNRIIVGHINIAAVIRVLKFINPKVEIILIAHGIDVWDKQKGAKKWLLKSADKIISVSNFTKSELIRVNEIDAKKIDVLPNCLDPFFELAIAKTDFFTRPQYLLSRYKIDSNTKILLTVSRIKSSEKYKGYDKVLEALSRIKKSSDVKFVYLLCGSYDEIEYNRVKEIIENLSLENNVLITGFIADDELINHYQLADVFVMPSKKEGFGIVFIEAAACGTNVIAGNSDGSVEAMLNGELGDLVSPDSVDEIYEAIQKNLTKEQSKDELLSKKTLANYSFQKYSQRLNNLLFEKNSTN